MSEKLLKKFISKITEVVNMCMVYGSGRCRLDNEFRRTLFYTYQRPEREFRSSKRHFKTLSLDELRSPDFNLLSDQEYSEEEEAEAMAETMDQYMSKTRTDYGSGERDRRKKPFFKHGERFKELLMKCPQHYLLVQETAEDAKKAIQEMAEYSKNCIMEHQEEENAAIRNQGASIKTLKIQIGQMSKVLQDRGFGSLPSLIETKLRDQFKLISTTIKADSHPIRHIGSPQYAVSDGQNNKLVYKSRQMTVPFPSRLDNHYCEEEEEGIYGLKFMEAYRASHINHTIP
ncbi:hypothetical protein Tco_1300831 [Tanacetum coccineum]